MYSIERMKNAVKINLAVYNNDDALLETCNFFSILATRDKKVTINF